MKAPFSAGPVLLLRQMGRAALDLLYPPLCLGCDARLPDAGAFPVCPACVRALPNVEPVTLRDRLGRYPAGDAIRHATALWLFDDSGTPQRLQHALKYGNRPSLGVRLGRLVGERHRADAPLPDLVVPVPLHRVRRLERGYNQSERIATGIADALGATVRPDLLRRTRATKTQVSLSQSERWANVAGAFALADAPEQLDGRRALLVDDVLTTGATLVAASTPLRAAGAMVDIAVLACARD